MSDTKTSIRNYIIENFLFGETDGFANDTSFLDQGILDSTGVLELVSYLEKTYGIEVSDDDLIPENLDSVDFIYAYLQRKQGAKV